jgi:hypothetical protein
MSSKPHILVLMSDNRPLSPDLNKNNNFMSFVAYINKQYCDKYGYDFKYVIPYYKVNNGNVMSCINVNTRQLRHSSFAKLAALRANIEKYDYVVYIDSDCCIKNFTISLEQIIEKYTDKHIIFQSAAPYHPTLPNSGFFIVKNVPENIGFLDKWYKTPTPLETSPEWQQMHNYSLTFTNYKFYPEKHREQDILWVFVVTNQIKIILMKDEIAPIEIPGQYFRHLYELTEGHLRDSYFRNIVRKLIKSGSPAFDHEINAINCEHLDTSTIYD